MSFEMICAWCGQSAGSAGVSNSHGVCDNCLYKLLGLPKLTPAELDQLPYGAIQIDAKGTILAYNSVESSLSGRLASEVIGQNFFQQVAPCTAVQDFAGRFEKFLSESDSIKTFPFIFPFPTGKIKVMISFVKVDSDRATIVVERKEQASKE